jgi:hypothetical protein
LHTLGPALDTGEHLTQRGGGCIRIDRSSGYVREERMKYHVVFPAEEKNVALRRAELAAKSLCELYGGEASTNNDYSYWVHLLAPIACLDTTENFGLLMGLLQLL